MDGSFVLSTAYVLRRQIRKLPSCSLARLFAQPPPPATTPGSESTMNLRSRAMSVESTIAMDGGEREYKVSAAHAITLNCVAAFLMVMQQQLSAFLLPSFLPSFFLMLRIVYRASCHARQRWRIWSDLSLESFGFEIRPRFGRSPCLPHCRRR